MLNIPYSVWSGMFNDLSPEQAVDELSSAGFRYAELSLEHGIDMLAQREGTPAQIGAALKQYAAERGFAFIQGHLNMDLELDNPTDVEELKRWLEMFAALGIKSAVLHATGAYDEPYEKQLEVRSAAIRELVEHIKDTDLVICLENLVSKPMVRTVDGILELIEACGGGEHLGICLDIGHLHRANFHGLTTQTSREFVAKAGDKLKALHIQDNHGENDDHLLPFTANGLKWKMLMQALEASGYDRLFNMELPGEAFAPLAVRRMKVRYAKQLTEYMFSDEFIHG